jgi:hypothetical protein
MTSQEFLTKEWPIVRDKVINTFCPLKKALGNTSLAEFFAFVKAESELKAGWEELKVFIEDNMAFEMLSAYQAVPASDPWAEKKILMRIQALEKIKTNINVPKVKVEDHKIEITYEDEA